NN
ncbi:6-phosphofructokinase isozyme 1, partial [Haemophilus influenzae]